MSVRLAMVLPVLFTAVGTAARAAEKGGDTAVGWVRALVEQDSERSRPPIRLPFIFRTTSEDIALEVGGIRGWSHWRLVSVTYFWTTISIRLLDRTALHSARERRTVRRVDCGWRAGRLVSRL